MPFQKGHKLAKGRPKGFVNKRTEEFREVLERNNFNVAQSMIDLCKKSIEIFDGYAEVYKFINENRDKEGLYPTEDKAHYYLKEASGLLRDIAGYTYPKLKAIEHTSSNIMEGLTAEEKVQMAEQAIKVLKSRVDGSKSGQSDT